MYTVNMRLYPEATRLFLDSGIPRTEQSKTSYRQALRAVQDRHPGLDVGQITTAHLAEYCLSANPAPNTVRRRKAMMIGFFSWATWHGLVASDPSAALKFEVRPKGGGVTAHNWLTEAEVADVLRACPDDLQGRRARVLLMHGFLLGLRCSELSQLSWRQYSPDLSRITFFGKGQKLAQLGVPPQVRAELQAWRREAPLGATAVLPKMSAWGPPDWSKTIISPKSINEIVHTAGARVGIDTLSPHDLRRTFAGILEAKGTSLPDISRLMRHSNVGTTSTYLEKNPHRTAALADTFTIAL